MCFFLVIIFCHFVEWVKRKNWSHKTAGICDDYLGITYYTKKRVLGGWREPRKKWFSKGGKSSIFYVLKRTWYIILNFTARRCLCVGNAGRSEVPNRNSICIPSVRKMNVWNTWYTNCRDFAYPTPHRTTTRIFLHAKFSARKKKMSDCQIGFSTQLEIRGVKKNSSKKFSRNFYLKNIEKQLLISKWLLTNHVVILHSV